MLSAVWKSLQETVMVTGAILKRELIGFLRTKKAWLVTICIIAAASLLPLESWPETEAPMAYLQALQAFQAFKWTFLAAIVIFVPPLAASSITAEREKETFELLHSSVNRPAAILFGKLLVSTVYFFLLLALTFPIVCVLFLIGGFQISDFLEMALTLATSIIVFGLIGLVCSLLNQHTHRAVLFAYLSSAPFLILFAVDEMVRLFVGGLITLIIFFILIENAQFPVARYPIFPEDHDRGSAPWKPGGRFTLPASNLSAWIHRRLLGDPSQGIADHRNPVFRAAARRRAREGIGLGYLIAISIWASMMLMAGLTWTVDIEGMAFIVQATLPNALVLYALAIFLPGAAALSLLAERSPGLLDALRSTTLSAHDILWGKGLAALFEGFKYWILGIGFVMVLLPFLIFKARFPHALVPFLVLINILVVMAVSVSSGLLGATLARASSTALIYAYLFSIGWLVIFFQALGFLNTRWGWTETNLSSFSPLWSVYRFFDRFSATDLWGFALSGLALLFIAALQYGLALGIFKARWLKDR